jgi:hypothetical protein
MSSYFKTHGGHCTRCDEPFGDNATAYMVLEHVVWAVGISGIAFTQRETVPVCDACVTEKELANATEDATCAGCGQRMKLSQYGRRMKLRYRQATCSNRCEQRERRKRDRLSLWSICAICKTTFRPKRRGDAKFCSSACRQRAYRSRSVSAAFSRSRLKEVTRVHVRRVHAH